MSDWLHITRGQAPLIIGLPHTGTDLCGEDGRGLVSVWRARMDTDWWIDRLYAGAAGLGATLLRTAISRSVIDVNRDPTGASLYPGQPTTGLCPTETFAGVALYAAKIPNAVEIERRRTAYFVPYHAALQAEIMRLKTLHPRVVVFDAHSIRSEIPRLFAGILPHLNIGTHDGLSCDPALTRAVAAIGDASGFSTVVNGRFKGGWTTRHYGQPEGGVHAIQLELAMRGYMAEPSACTPETWPSPWDAPKAAPMAAVVMQILRACLAFANKDQR